MRDNFDDLVMLQILKNMRVENRQVVAVLDEAKEGGTCGVMIVRDLNHHLLHISVNENVPYGEVYVYLSDEG